MLWWMLLRPSHNWGLPALVPLGAYDSYSLGCTPGVKGSQTRREERPQRDCSCWSNMGSLFCSLRLT